MKSFMYKNNIIKHELIESGKLKNQCAICGQGPQWQGKELILILDYINGIESDNRIVNLRLLCPNCNSQQYNPLINNQLIEKSNPKKPCIRCGMPSSINSKTGLCKRCLSLATRKTEWPEKETLEKDMQVLSWKDIGRKYNVSDNSVRRWAKKYGLLVDKKT
jgi:ribosomal protein S14